jgi:ubiquinone/menaquinone biosynthesis C-methylase UbiE
MATLQPRTASATPRRQLPHPAPRHPVPEQPTTSEAYRSHAGRYDRRTEAFRPWRELLVDQLPARRGDTVLDVGCGTGLCLPLLQDKVGASGTIVGIDASPKCSRSPATG